MRNNKNEIFFVSFWECRKPTTTEFKIQKIKNIIKLIIDWRFFSTERQKVLHHVIVEFLNVRLNVQVNRKWKREIGEKGGNKNLSFGGEIYKNPCKIHAERLCDKEQQKSLNLRAIKSNLSLNSFLLDINRSEKRISEVWRKSIELDEAQRSAISFVVLSHELAVRKWSKVLWLCIYRELSCILYFN